MGYYQQLITMLKENGIVRPKDVTNEGIPRQYLQRLYKRGVVERVGRGLYALPDTLQSEHYTFAQIAAYAPNSVICLLSALQFHNLTTQLPYDVWIAIEGTSWQPQLDYPPLTITRLSGKSFTYGIETHEIDNVPVKIYSVAKTVADCFKFRNKIGVDVAIEALRDATQYKRTTRDAIWDAAKVCRISTVIKPYLQAI